MDGKLNIAMFGHKRIPSREGGIEVVIEQLCSRMVGEGHCVCCYNRKGHHVSGAEYDEAHRDSNYKGIRIKEVPTIEKKGLAAISSSFFASILTALGGYDVVHIHAEGPALFCPIPKLFGKKIIVTIHGIDHKREKWKGSLGAKLILLGEKSAVRFADEIIVLSKNAQVYFERTYGRKTRRIPNGVNLPKIRTADLIVQKYGLHKDDYILFLGRIVPEKGLRCLIEAYKGVRTDKKLVIAGGSSDTQEFLEELKKQAGEDDRILFTGFVKGQLLEELYSNAYIYTLPSDLEGMPLSLLEAMSYGNCCLTSDIEECTEVVGDKAVTFRKQDAADLREKLQMLCQNPTVVEEVRAGAAQYICAKYDWDRIVKETLALYR